MLDVRLYILLSHTQIKISRTNFTHWYRQWHAYKHSPHRPPPATLLHSLWPGWIVCCHGNRILNTHTDTQWALLRCSRYFLISCVIKLQQMNWYHSITASHLQYNNSGLHSFPIWSPSPALLQANIVTLHVGPFNHICGGVSRMFCRLFWRKSMTVLCSVCRCSRFLLQIKITEMTKHLKVFFWNNHLTEFCDASLLFCTCITSFKIN